MNQYIKQARNCVKSLLLKEEIEIYGIHQSHDKLCKDILCEKEEFVNFINEFIEGANLDINEIEKVDGLFITENYGTREADIIYKENNREIYYLIEHQSTIDESMAFRMLNYSVNLINRVVDYRKVKTKRYKIPNVVPIVLYTGKNRWNAPTCLSKKQEINKIDLKLELEYKLIDINNIDNEKLYEINTKMAYAMIIEKNKSKDELIKALSNIAEKCDTEEKARKMQRIIKYILSAMLDKEETERIIGKYVWKEGKDVMTAIECFVRDIIKEREKSREEGREEGRKDGIREGRIKLVKELVDNGVDINLLSQITGLTDKEIMKISDNKK